MISQLVAKLSRKWVNKNSHKAGFVGWQSMQFKFVDLAVINPDTGLGHRIRDHLPHIVEVSLSFVWWANATDNMKPRVQLDVIALIGHDEPDL